MVVSYYVTVRAIRKFQNSKHSLRGQIVLAQIKIILFFPIHVQCFPPSLPGGHVTLFAPPPQTNHRNKKKSYYFFATNSFAFVGVCRAQKQRRGKKKSQWKCNKKEDQIISFLLFARQAILSLFPEGEVFVSIIHPSKKFQALKKKFSTNRKISSQSRT